MATRDYDPGGIYMDPGNGGVYQYAERDAGQNPFSSELIARLRQPTTKEEADKIMADYKKRYGTLVGGRFIEDGDVPDLDMTSPFAKSADPEETAVRERIQAKMKRLYDKGQNGQAR